MNFKFEYTARDGNQVSIKPNERYVLVAKTNDHWWHVRKDETTKPFFIPAKYVTELPPENNWTFPEPPVEEGRQDPPFSETTPPKTNQHLEVTIRDPMSIKRDSEKDGHRISTFIIPQDLYNFRLDEPEMSEAKAKPDPEPYDLYNDITQMDGTPNSSPLAEEDGQYDVPLTHFPSVRSHGKEAKPSSASSEILSPKSPSSDLDEDIVMLKRAGWDMKIWDLMEDGIYASIDDEKDGEVVKETNNDKVDLPPFSMVSTSAPSTTATTKEQTPGSPIGLPDAIAERVRAILFFLIIYKQCDFFSNTEVTPHLANQGLRPITRRIRAVEK